uniref:Uncharacterized protein n=1 Tax=Tanacetum cinerariifolium TaxID=118510 RepID=A0A6L2JCQ7_TANCI|nr:hypothetical protein [Tanacetum cinerariifolium]
MLVVEIESFGMSSDEFDKETRSSDGLQPKQADMSFVHALDVLHLHEFHIIPTMKDVARSNLNNKENDFMLDILYGAEIMEELTATVMLMAQIQPADGNTKTMSSYDAKAVSEERKLRADKDTTEQILKEKDKIQSDFFKIENEKKIIQHETQLAKKAFKEQENRYLKDIVDLEEKLSSHDQIIYKIAVLGYNNPKRLKKEIAAQQKMYDGEMLHNAKLNNSQDSEDTLEDSKES